MFEGVKGLVNRARVSRLTIGQRLAAIVAPPVCALCGGDGQAGETIWGLDLCRWCEGACPRLPPGCPRCGEPGSTAGPCPGCVVRPPPFELVVAPFRYAHPVDHMVRSLKFEQDLAFGRVLGELVARARRTRPGPLPTLVVPVPLHRSRFVERGFNQAEAVARPAAARLGLRIAPRLLERRRATQAQSGLPAAQRAGNLHEAFRTRGPCPAHVALVDDVLTTGSTARAAARALRMAGATRVEVWVAARAVAPGREDGDLLGFAAP